MMNILNDYTRHKNETGDTCSIEAYIELELGQATEYMYTDGNKTWAARWWEADDTSYEGYVLAEIDEEGLYDLDYCESVAELIQRMKQLAPFEQWHGFATA